MSDHLELHEKFHALRLQFEHEKRQVTNDHLLISFITLLSLSFTNPICFEGHHIYSPPPPSLTDDLLFCILFLFFQFAAKIMADARMYVNSSTANKGNSSSGGSGNMESGTMEQFDSQQFVHEYGEGVVGEAEEREMGMKKQGEAEEREMGTKKQKGDNGEAIETRDVQQMNPKRKFVTPSKF